MASPLVPENGHVASPHYGDLTDERAVANYLEPGCAAVVPSVERVPFSALAA